MTMALRKCNICGNETFYMFIPSDNNDIVAKRRIYCSKCDTMQKEELKNE